MVGDLDCQIYQYTQISALEEDQNMIQVCSRRAISQDSLKGKGRINEKAKTKTLTRIKALREKIYQMQI